MATGASRADLAIVLVDAAQGRADPDPPPRHHRPPARHPQLRAGGEQDGPGRLRPGPVRGDRATTSPPSRDEVGDRRRHRHPGLARSTATMSPRPRRACPGMTGPTLLRLPRGRSSPRAAPAVAAFRMPVQQVIRDGGARFYAGTIASGSGAARRRGRDRARRHAAPRSPGSRPWTATSTRPTAGQSVALAFAAEVDCSRGDMLAGRRPAAGRRPVRGDPDLDGRGAAAPRPPISAEARHADASPPPCRSPNTSSASTRWSSSRRRRWR